MNSRAELRAEALRLQTPLTEAFEILDPLVEDPMKLIECIASRCRTTPAVVKEWLIEETKRAPIRPLIEWPKRRKA